MTLKVLINNKKIESKRSELSEIETYLNNLQDKSTELMNSIDEANTDEELSLIEEEIDKLEKDKKEKEDLKKNLTDEIESLEKETEELRSKEPKTGVGSMSNDKRELKEGIELYIRSKGVSIRDDIKLTDIGAVVPKDISYVPENQVITVQDLSEYVTKIPVTTNSGTWPVLNRATEKFNTTEELEENPALGKPTFNKVEWTVKTYRGAIPISQEAIDDAEIDVLALIQRNAHEQKINTVNNAIGEALKTFTPKQITNVDELKKLLNVDLDPAYKREFVVTQSFYQVLDSLKDKNGRYLLNENITGSSVAQILGHPIRVVSDTLLGNSGDKVGFIGDLSRGILFADRAEFTIEWTNSNIYGKYLMAGLRFGVKKADEKAGFFVTLNIAEV